MWTVFIFPVLQTSNVTQNNTLARTLSPLENRGFIAMFTGTKSCVFCILPGLFRGVARIYVTIFWWLTWNIGFHDDIIKWKHFPRFWPFVMGIHRSPEDSPHKSQWRGALMFSLICAWTNDWANNRDAGDLRRHHAHYDVTVIPIITLGKLLRISVIFCIVVFKRLMRFYADVRNIRDNIVWWLFKHAWCRIQLSGWRHDTATLNKMLNKQAA